MHGLCRVAVQVLVGVHHHVQGVALHALLRGELGAEAVDTEDQLGGEGHGERGRQRSTQPAVLDVHDV